MQNESEYYDEEDEEEPEDGIPWYLVNEEENAQQGIKFDDKDPKEVAALQVQAPPACSEELVCLLVRRATLNRKVRAKRFSIDKLWGEPTLFLQPDTDN